MNGAPPPAPQLPPGSSTIAVSQQQQAGFASPSVAHFSSETVVQQAAVSAPVPAAADTIVLAPAPTSDAPAPA
jgi:hypothetical protein